MKHPRVWIDLSDIATWKGHYTGIQHVVASLGGQFAASEEDVRFFVYDQRRNEFLRTQLSPVTRPETDDLPALDRTGSLSIRLKTLMRWTYAHTPTRIQRIVPPERRAQLRAAGGKVISSLRANARATSISTDGPAQFERGDVVLVLGAAWERPGLLPSLVKLRQDHGIKLHCLIYDLIPVIQPQFFGPGLPERYTKFMFELAANSDGIMAISQSTSQDFKHFCTSVGIIPPPVSVIRLGDNPELQPVKSVPVTGVEPGNYILAVGSFEARKNYALLYTVWKQAALNGQTLPRLIIVGSTGWAAGDTLAAIQRDPDVVGAITVMGGISRPRLMWLYQNAMFTVYPSTYEGWGLPIAESLAYGKPCLASNTSSMPEVGGDLVDYFSPFDPQGCLSAITAYLEPGVLDAHRKRIRSEFKPTSWDATFQQVQRHLADDDSIAP